MFTVQSSSATVTVRKKVVGFQVGSSGPGYSAFISGGIGNEGKANIIQLFDSEGKYRRSEYTVMTHTSLYADETPSWLSIHKRWIVSPSKPMRHKSANRKSKSHKYGHQKSISLKLETEEIKRFETYLEAAQFVGYTASSSLTRVIERTGGDFEYLGKHYVLVEEKE